MNNPSDLQQYFQAQMAARATFTFVILEKFLIYCCKYNLANI